MIGRPPVPFWDRVNTDGPVPAARPGLGRCWIWTGSIDGGGYGGYWSEGRVVKAHRYAFENQGGVIPTGLTIDHLCRNRACVNPDHLEPVTKRDNNLRGTSPMAVNARKTSCVHGHPFDETNTLHRPNGKGRQCRRCAHAATWRSGTKHGVRHRSAYIFETAQPDPISPDRRHQAHPFSDPGDPSR